MGGVMAAMDTSAAHGVSKEGFSQIMADFEHLVGPRLMSVLKEFGKGVARASAHLAIDYSTAYDLLVWLLQFLRDPEEFEAERDLDAGGKRKKRSGPSPTTLSKR